LYEAYKEIRLRLAKLIEDKKDVAIKSYGKNNAKLQRHAVGDK
jgi:hypothetical protein